ncbi:hypothetical protein J437_LFUL019135 [Ladona fulva]|uniref:Uncharacterized protein n=1 Tax=Ladona fulva TaxID=123851 RepID=A0A8K0KSA7_LADFU|nr:hypothetical protein J437_LFUL019135 [Ladona fulva]
MTVSSKIKGGGRERFSVKLVLGEASEIKIHNISLSNNTIQRRISDMSMDVMEQILSEIKASPVFSFRLDESTDRTKNYYEKERRHGDDKFIL